MLAMSWPLWGDGGVIPRVPFVPGLSGPGGWGSWGVFGAILVTIAATMLGRGWRVAAVASALLIGFVVARDQNRLQPWVYQYLVIGLAMAGTSRVRGMRLARCFVASLYFYSGLSKFDVSFVGEMGPTFLETALGLVGLNASGWADWAKVLAILSMPGWELAIAAGLLARSTRRAATVAAIGQHLGLLLILGPGGLGHSPIVVAWNVAMIVQDGLLFWPELPVLEPANWRTRVVELAFLSILIVPMGERAGLCDSWPAHALYASHVERTEVWVHEDDVDQLPEGVARRLGPIRPDSWRKLDLTNWSRDVRGTPFYPQGRVGNAIAEYLAERSTGPHPIRVVQWGLANPWSGDRSRVEAVGLDSIRKLSKRWSINAHPAGRMTWRDGLDRGIVALARTSRTQPLGPAPPTDFGNTVLITRRNNDLIW